MQITARQPVLPVGGHLPRLANNAQAWPLNILIGVDPSVHALAATRFARDLLLPQGSNVTALAVLDPYQQVNHPDLEKAMNQVTEVMRSCRIQVKTVLLQGHPDEQLIRFTYKHSIDLILLGAVGLHTHLGVFLDGMPQRVVKGANCPVLIARAPYTRLRHVLLVADGSWESLRAIRYLAKMSFTSEILVTVLCIHPNDFTPDPETLVTRPWQLKSGYAPWLLRSWFNSFYCRQEYTLHSSRAIMRYAREVLSAAGFESHIAIRNDSTVAEVIQYARNNDVDIVIVGSRTQVKFTCWIADDFIRQLIHHADCSVLVVKEGYHNP